MALTTTVRVMFACVYTNVLSNSTVADQLGYVFDDALASGVVIDAADKLWHSRRTLAATTAEDIDLAGSLTDSLGAAVTFVKVKAVLIRNRTVAAGYKLTVGGAASNAWETWTPAAGSKVYVGPDGVLFLYNPSLAAFGVTAATGDILKIENANAAAVTYDIIIVGTSA